MSVTVDDVAKWQPSVLHLLPFSRNNAGVASSMMSSAANQQASYVRRTNCREFPSLGISGPGVNSREKPRSKSAAVFEDSKRYSQTQQQHRLLRATSERLSRPQGRLTGRNFIERAQSEYSTKGSRKLTQEVVTFAIKDINEQILDRTFHRDESSPEFLGIHSPKQENNSTRVKPLLKPVLKPNEVRWPRTNPRFWRSSTISPGERELQRHKTALDIQLSSLRRSKRVKLNVKDLPRSQTPIGENDPDKLNMKQVIAFLQSSGEVSGVARHDNEENMNGKPRAKSSAKTRKSSAEVQTNSKNSDNTAALLIAAKSRRKVENSAEVTGECVKSDTFLTQGDEPKDKTRLGKEDDLNCDRMFSYSQHGARNYPPLQTPDEGLAHVDSELGKHHQHRHQLDSHNQHRTQPESIQLWRDGTDFRIPARIRQIRDSTMDNRPFRLHRFLTLVSNTSEDNKTQQPKKGSNRGINTRQSSASLPSGPQSRSPSKLSKSRDNNRENSISEENKSYADTKGYFLRTNGVQKNEDDKNNKTNIQDGKRKSKKSHSSTSKVAEGGESGTNGRVICLPTVPVDVDSEDDFISLPTVPSKSTRKDLSLSANGKAILAKHFPQVENFQKANMRPHSEKILLKRRMDIISNGRERPSSVKASDLVEWGGMENPGRIFLSDRTEDSSTKIPTSPQNNTLPAQNTDSVNHVTNGDIDNEISQSKAESPDAPSNKMDSPTKSKHGDEPITILPESQAIEDVPNDPNRVSESKVSPKGKSVSGARISKPESVSPSLSDPVKLTLRKERNLTRESTYMVDMKSTENSALVENGHVGNSVT